MTEAWISIDGYVGLYEISSLGRVMSTRFGVLKEVKSTVTNKGYLKCGLTKDKKQKTFFVHRLVASAFIENRHKKPFVNHIDYDRKNNKISNLEWCTREENSNHSLKNYKRGESKHNSKLISDDIIYMRILRDCLGFKFRELSEIFDVEITTTAQICKRKKWRHII